MSHRLMTWQKATALVPLALLSGAWTASLAVTPTATAAAGDAPALPDGTSLPATAVEAPASVSAPGLIAPGVPVGSAKAVVAGASANGIPSAALAAYQRAAQVIDSADPGCHIDWTLIAAIGRVESDHGRYGGNTLSDEGVSTPGIYGIPLDGTHGTAKIADTDAGEIDDDPVFDRAVGPMQFIPSTWSIVGVDGDGNGIRNAQDIDDAALATAVYLCSGDEDLSTAAGQEAAVYRYNHSQQYVDLVLSIMRAYGTGDYSAIPNGSVAPATFTPSYGDAVIASGTRGFTPYAGKAHHRGSTGPARTGSGGSGGGSTATAGDGSTGGDDTTSAEGPISTESGTPSSGDPGKVVDDTVKEVVKKATDPVKKVTEPVTTPVVNTISAGAEAVSFCNGQLSGLLGAPLIDADAVVQGCAGKIAGMTEEDAAAAIPNTLAGVLTWLGL